MKLPKLGDLEVVGKKVLVRMDLDLSDSDDSRLETSLETLLFLTRNKAKITIIGHKGRPGGKAVESLSLKPVSQQLEKLLIKELGEKEMKEIDIDVMENLRFNPGEEANDKHFAEHLAEDGEIYINEAFAASHRRHASIVGLPRLLPHAAGFRFFEEVETLSKILEKPKKPALVIIGGAKKDKLALIEDLKKFADRILIAGKLPEYMLEIKDEKLIVARLLPDKEDMTVRSMEEFEEEIEKAGTIVVSGPMGKFEKEGHRQGTKRILEAIANSSAFKLAGGGETEKAISMFGLEDRFDWVSVGGGASLQFLAKGTLPGIEALLD